MTTNQDYSDEGMAKYYGATAVDLWLLEERAKQNGQTELATEINTSRTFCENQAKFFQSQANESAERVEANKEWWQKMNG
jgi:1,6-anhydro-N-acetylmuramate kinase